MAPIIGVRLRYRSKLEICSDLAPISRFLGKHKGYSLWKKSEPKIYWYLSANIKVIFRPDFAFFTENAPIWPRFFHFSLSVQTSI